MTREEWIYDVLEYHLEEFIQFVLGVAGITSDDPVEKEEFKQILNEFIEDESSWMDVLNKVIEVHFKNEEELARKVLSENKERLIEFIREELKRIEAGRY